MHFVRTEELKTGMRLARPIYSQKGVLLFERNSKLSPLAIESVKNFGLLGIYILEPAEPLPPMTEEDLEFERFQMMSIFSIQEEMRKIMATGNQNRMNMIANMIIKKYGHLDDKINFYQNLRSREDYVYRHSLNTAILCAMITHKMNVRLDIQLLTVIAAIVHDIGKIQQAGDLAYREDLSQEEKQRLLNAQLQADDLIENAFATDGAAIRRICHHAAQSPSDRTKMVLGAKILAVANRYDEMTAMSLGGESKSEVGALKELMERDDLYDSQAVKALIDSIHILFPGVSVELNNGEKALVLVENKREVLRPVLLSFKDNRIIDLGLRVNDKIQIVDIMKTLDNRYIMNTEALKKATMELGEK